MKLVFRRQHFPHLRSFSEPAGRQVRGLLLWQQERRDWTCERQSWALTWRDTTDLVESSAHRSGRVKASKHNQRSTQTAERHSRVKGYRAAGRWRVWCGGSVSWGERLPVQDRGPSAAPTGLEATFLRSSAHHQTHCLLPAPPGPRAGRTRGQKGRGKIKH